MKKLYCLLLLSLVVAGPAFGAQRQGVIHHQGSIMLPGNGYVDYLIIGGPEHRLYAGYASENALAVVDMGARKLVSMITGLKDVRSIGLVDDRNLGFTSNRGDGTIGVIDLKSNRLRRKILDGRGPDAIIYDSAAALIYVSNHEGRSGTFIDPVTEKVTASIPLGGLAEYAQADPTTGLVFQNLEDKNEIVVIDPRKKAVVAQYPTAPGKEPTGLALDAGNHRLFCACGNDRLVVIDSTDGAVRAVIPIGSGVDAVAWDPVLHRIYTANGESGTMTVIRQASPDKYEVIENVRTHRGAHALAVDPANHRIYVVHGNKIEVYDSSPQR